MESFFSSGKTERREVYSIDHEMRRRPTCETEALDDRIFEPDGLRETGWISLSGCQTEPGAGR